MQNKRHKPNAVKVQSKRLGPVAGSRKDSEEDTGLEVWLVFVETKMGGEMAFLVVVMLQIEVGSPHKMLQELDIAKFLSTTQRGLIQMVHLAA
jgi:hypothetical protein